MQKRRRRATTDQTETNDILTDVLRQFVRFDLTDVAIGFVQSVTETERGPKRSVFVRFERPRWRKRLLVIQNEKGGLRVIGVTRGQVDFDRSGNATVSAVDIVKAEQNTPSTFLTAAPLLRNASIMPGATGSYAISRCAAMLCSDEPLHDPREFQALAAVLVGMGACDRDRPRAVAKAAFLALVQAFKRDRFRAGFSGSEWNLASLAALIGDKRIDPGDTAIAMPLGLPCARKFDGYCFDRQRRAYLRLSDGNEFQPASAEFGLIRRALLAAKHRNGSPNKEPVIFSLPVAYAAARAAYDFCETCHGKTQSPCDLLRPVIVSAGYALLTATDLDRIWPALAAGHFDRMVSREQLLTGAAGYGPLIRAIGSSNHDDTLESLLKTALASRARDSADDRQRAADAHLRYRLASRSLRLRCGVCMEDIASDQLVERAADRLIAAFSVAADGRNSSLTAAAGELLSGHRPSLTTASSSGHLMVPGIEELSASCWDLGALRPFLAPCSGRIMDACSRDRHPSYDERMHMGIFMCDIMGLAENKEAYYATWRSMFAHPEPSCSLYGKPSSLDTSEYGRSAAENFRKLGLKGGRCGCPHAIKTGICPFSLMSGPSGEAGARDALRGIEGNRRQRATSLQSRSIEDVVTMTFISRAPGAPAAAATCGPDDCRKLCANYLYAAFGQNLARLNADKVSSPTRFYKAARAREEQNHI
jgi:hypothetical protein